jgi:hypothetical protein
MPGTKSGTTSGTMSSTTSGTMSGTTSGTMPTTLTSAPAAAAELAYLLSPRAVRERAHALLALGEAGGLEDFAVELARLPEIAERVVAVTRQHYPDLGAIPPHGRWRHFGAGGLDRAAALEARLARLDPTEALRARFDLLITSVLLDAGAGDRWHFAEPGTGVALGRSEGLAVASYHLFAAGGLSTDPAGAPLRADADALAALDEPALAAAFQVGPDNPLVGVAGRVELLRRLGAVVRAWPGGGVRVGELADHLLAQVTGAALPATVILTSVLERLGPIWPGRHSLHGVNLGDTWPHPAVGLVPFHKLSQWLSYSMIEPLEAHGVRVTGLDELTGLAEYRNGGLFVDGGVLVPRHPGVLGGVHAVASPLVVAWRALTVALLDRVAVQVRGLLAQPDLPLVKLLEGGTWRAGRVLAAERRPGGGPPIRVDSDGTVF